MGNMSKNKAKQMNRKKKIKKEGENAVFFIN